jgi:Ni/Co efflux regulator RcnB
MKKIIFMLIALSTMLPSSFAQTNSRTDTSGNRNKNGTMHRDNKNKTSNTRTSKKRSHRTNNNNTNNTNNNNNSRTSTSDTGSMRNTR